MEWRGMLPYLHLIYTLTGDKWILRRNGISQGRLVLENKNSEGKLPIVWELLATYWNDEKFVPTYEVLSDLHSDFEKEQVLPHNLISNLSPATPGKCKGKINSIISKSNCIFTNWERNGQVDDRMSSGE